MKRVWENEMGEISGFGGGYEAVCRAMVLAGIEYIDNHPEENFHFYGYEDNEPAKNLTRAMMQAPVFHDGKKIQDKVSDNCTGTMHQAAVSHCLAYKRLGWDEYKSALINRPKKEDL